MNLRRIVTLKELALFTPVLLSLHETLEGRWEPDATAHEFLAELINIFEPTSYLFGDFDESGKLAYFAVILRESESRAFFWLFYMNKDFRLVTKQVLTSIKDFLRREGFSYVYTQSTRTSSSYERWLEKFGAEKVAITYKFNLNTP